MNDGKERSAGTELMSRDAAALMERVVVGGDLSKLTPQERMQYYQVVCKSVGLNPFTRPFEYLFLQGKMTLYARKEATEQLRELHDVSVTKLEATLMHDEQEDLYSVTAYGVNAKGRQDSATGVVPLGTLRGEQKANAMMKAETKAKRRLTLSLCGLGMLDESEVDVTAAAVTVTEKVEAPRHPLANALDAQGNSRPPDVAEVRTLFPTPEEDRRGLIQRAKIATARLDKTTVAEKKREMGLDEAGKWESVDLAALLAYVQWAEQPL